jgi:isoleucyl-tRNA synthetase
LKPVYWCIHDRTALAEAEVEYEMHKSPSVYVRYKWIGGARLIHGMNDPTINDPLDQLTGREVYAIIWTTTPWTLPASVAIAFHPDFEYVALEVATGEIYIVAEALVGAVSAACNLGPTKEVARFKGIRLERMLFQHPFLDRTILGVNATYVTADTGTGAVHTAPAHGADDFYTGTRYNLDQTCRVDAAGHISVDPTAWHQSAPPAFDGKKVWAANPIIIAMLEERGALLAGREIEHSYPHCWRCHKPVIFRATEQWFIGLETPVKRADGTETTYRQQAIEEIDKVIWDPAWGKERITNMIATRPDWCISRQRIWGVPIAVFLCTGCNKPIVDAALNRAVLALIEQEGIEAWHSEAAEKLLATHAGLGKCAHCGGQGFRKETDILDVWFDSGVSWFAVCESDAELSAAYKKFQKSDGVDVLYLEGGDQHRGWFHSSLLTSVALRGRAPYSHVSTAGWTLDEQGRAMSKSLGNGVDPVDIANRMGGEIVRLWVASIDFREDMAASENLMARCAEIYKKLRNTFRFLLGNLSGFNPATDKIGEAELLPLDRYMLARTRELTEKVRQWYTDFEFHRVYHAVNEFAIVDLSSFYLDVLKDRMYTFAPTSKERRSAQTTLWKITETLVRLVAPILSFTADEVWEYLPVVEGREKSVHLAQFPAPEEVFSEDPAKLLAEWKQIFEVRDEALRVLEEARQAKTIGKGLEADLHVYAKGATLDLLKRHKLGLKELINVSSVVLLEWGAHSGPMGGDKIKALSSHEDYAVFLSSATGHKCARCWNFMPEVSSYGIWENVCTRCQSALREMKIAPPQAEVSAEAAQ